MCFCVAMVHVVSNGFPFVQNPLFSKFWSLEHFLVKRMGMNTIPFIFFPITFILLKIGHGDSKAYERFLLKEEIQASKTCILRHSHIWELREKDV